MSNETEAYIKFFKDRYQADPVAVCTGSEGLVVFQAGAAYQREQDKKLVEALETIALESTDEQARCCAHYYLAAYRAQQEKPHE